MSLPKMGLVLVISVLIAASYTIWPKSPRNGTGNTGTDPRVAEKSSSSGR